MLALVSVINIFIIFFVIVLNHILWNNHFLDVSIIV